MNTTPAYARRGVGRLILSLCQKAAKEEGFKRLELMGTMAGEPLYTKYGFVPIERLTDDRGLVYLARTTPSRLILQPEQRRRRLSLA